MYIALYTSTGQVVIRYTGFTHKGWDCKDDLKYDEFKFKSSRRGLFNDLSKKEISL